MAAVLPPNSPNMMAPEAQNVGGGQIARKAAPASLPVPLPTAGPLRSGHPNLDTFSPVNQDGSFAYDRVLKSGTVRKRTRKTKQWKHVYLVLRPNLLSLYKTSTEERLLKQITLSELSAVTYLKDPKGRRSNLFGLYSPSRNWHLQAETATEANSWVELIKAEARIDEQEQEILLASPARQKQSFEIGKLEKIDSERLASSSPEPSIRHSSITRDGIKVPGIRRLSAPSLDYSADGIGPSDFSDTASQSLGPTASMAGNFLGRKQKEPVTHHETPYLAPLPQRRAQSLSFKNSGQASVTNAEPPDSDRVIWHGYLLYLKSKGGVRQWKRTWAVLRPKHLAFYKDDQEYAAILILPLANIVSAVEIDPVSKNKKHCMQIISEDRSYRFCATSEDTLAEWLGALKSQLVRKKEKESLRR